MALDYQQLMQDALRAVVRAALEDVAENGFEGDHHFYIAFRTRDPGVDIPPHLRDLYPDTMTIVVQHQFWNLGVSSDAFGVTLTFGGKRHHLVIPFSAIETFADPSAEFGLKLSGGGVDEPVAGPSPAPSMEPESDEAPHSAGSKLPDGVVRLDDFRKTDH